MSVVLVATGGTIASTVQPGGGVAVALTGAELLATVPKVYATDVEVVDVVHGASWNFDIETMAATALQVRAAIEGGADGVVVTHGTDTLEDTAWLTDLLTFDLTERAPIVFTGAMRNAGEPDGDGPGNLRDALALARSREGLGRGALVCINGEIHEARFVTKVDSQRLDTFTSYDARPWTRPPHVADVVPNVALLRSYGGIDGALVDWFVERGARGIVIDGSGAGNVSGTLVPGIERALAAGVPVVVTTRCLTGSVAPIYGGPGGGHSLAALGVVAGADLSASKARLALAVALAVDPSIDAVREWFGLLA